jgi:hypothetical protein
MPLQGIIFARAAHRITRVRNKELAAAPVGQIVGRMNSVRPARDVVYDIVEEWIETNQKIAEGVAADR